MTGDQTEIASSLLTDEKNPLDQAEAETIRQVLKKYGGDRTKAANELSVGRTTLWRKMKKYRLA
jgi:transcriptional regulator with PAS, ATPase and Fis domain